MPTEHARGYLEGLRAARRILKALRGRTSEADGVGRTKRYAWYEAHDLIQQAEHEEVQPPVTFYAKIDRCFHLECPACGALDHVTKRYARHRGSWNPDTARWRCPGCRKQWIVGVALWTPAPGPATPPGDQLRSTNQALREQGRPQRGIWLAGEKGRRAEQVNVVVGDEKGVQKGKIRSE